MSKTVSDIRSKHCKKKWTRKWHDTTDKATVLIFLSVETIPMRGEAVLAVALENGGLSGIAL